MSSPGSVVTIRTALSTAVRLLACGLVIVAVLWLTVVPLGVADRSAQAVLAAVALAGVVITVRLPVIAAIVTGLATCAAWLLGDTADPFVLTGFAVFVMAERRGSRRFPWWMFGAAAGVALVMLGFSAEGSEGRFRYLLLSAVVLAAAWVLGVRTRELQRESAARSRAEERLRLARDVHDVLSHSLGTIGMQAGIAAHVSSLGESDLRDVLREVEVSARGSLAELMGLLQRERPDETASGEASSALSLTATLTDLARSAERGNLRVQLHIIGDIDGLPAAVRTTVHRIVQEAVTNCVRHAAASALIIRVHTAGAGVLVEVIDDGRGGTPSGRDGHGLTGMRERVAILGGTLQIDTAAPGFTVLATLPALMPTAMTDAP